MKNFLLFLLFIILLGVVGHYDYESEVMTHKQDEINKREVIKDMQLRCLNGTLDKDDMWCKGM